jgi:hypothetical protein
MARIQWATVAGFIQALDETQARFRDLGSDGYEVAPERLDEGRLVEACVDRFVIGELDATRRLTASRNYLPGCPPSLAEKLGDRYNKAATETIRSVEHAIRKALAVGYIAMCEADGRNGIPADWAKQVRSAGANSLIADLKPLGLTRFLGGSKLNQLGMLYAQAGVLLRIVQTDRIPQDEVEAVIARVRADANRPWQFSAYAA